MCQLPRVDSLLVSALPATSLREFVGFGGSGACTVLRESQVVGSYAVCRGQDSSVSRFLGRQHWGEAWYDRRRRSAGGQELQLKSFVEFVKAEHGVIQMQQHRI